MIGKIVWLWQFPQHILALLVILVTRAKLSFIADGVGVYVSSLYSFFGISLGQYIILGNRSLRSKTIYHEVGHSKQSLWLGPFYLIIVGIPSLTMNIMSHYSLRWGKGSFANNYYNRWPENWADKLGKVER